MNFYNKVNKIYFITGVIILMGCAGLYQFLSLDFTQVDKTSNPYAFTKKGNSVVSTNLQNGFLLEFGNGSFEISSTKKSNAYQLQYQLKDIDVNRSKLNLSPKPKFVAESGQLKESHKDFHINYTNSAKGLRQDFVINDGPTDKVSIHVNLALKTNLAAQKNDQFSILMTDSLNGAINIYYKDLIVYDANGKFLNSEMFLHKTEDGSYDVTLVASGEDVTYPITVDPLSTSDTGFESTIDSTYTGFSVTGNCDINNDGFCDAVIGSYGYTHNAIKNAGKVDVFLGKMSGINLSATPDFTILGGTKINKAGFTGLGIGGKFGYSLDCGGDLNNDTYDDIIIGAPSTSMIDTTGGGADTLSEVGAFYIFYGNAGGLSLTNADTVYGTQATMALGFKVAGLGDVNGGGFGDVAVSAPGFDNNKGVVHIYEGRMAGGINRTPVKSLLGSAAGEQYGTALAGPGDINGDGLQDILIGAHNYTYIAGTRRDTSAGRAHLFLGNSTSISSTPAWQAIGPHKNAQFGFSVSGAGNFDGIGQRDILVGANQYNPQYVTTMPDTILCLTSDSSSTAMFNCYGKGKGQGAVFVYSGTNTGLSTSITSTILNESSSTGFGSAVADAGDVDGDGLSDIIIGAPFYTRDSIAAQGAVYGYYGKNFTNGLIRKEDWCVFGEKGNSHLGTAIDRFGGCGNPKDTVGVILGAYGYNSMGPIVDDTQLRGAAFVFKRSTCGLKKYDKPQFLSFDSDTLFVDSESGKCGANVSFTRPTVGANCPATLTVLTGIDSSGLFPIGINRVTFRISSEGVTVDSSFIIVVKDVESPVPSTCSESTILTLPSGATSMPITWTDPVFTDNHTCSGGLISLSQISGEVKNTVLPVGVYPIVYQATDAAGNVSFCTFRVIISKTSEDGRDCTFQTITSNTTVSQPTSTDGDVRLTKNLKEFLSLNNGNFGLSLLLSLFEGASGISIPGWIKTALGEAGTGINLAFVEVKFNFLPTIDMAFGAYYKIKEATPLALNVNYSGNVCSVKPVDKLYGCRDTIPFATSFFVDQNPANTFLKVTPGQLNQTFGVFMRDFEFRWRISFEVSACIGVPLCVPIVGPCLGCLGYRDSYSTGVDVFEPIRLLTGSSAIELDLISVCDKSFQQGATIFSVFNCLGIDPAGADSFVKNLLNELPVGPDANPIDPFFYDKNSDQFVFEPNRIPKAGNKIPEMKLRFGRLTNGETVTDPGFPARVLPTEMGRTTVNGSKLMITGRENNLFSAEVDIFSLLYYAIPVSIQQSLACSGIDIGTRTIDIGTPKVTPASGGKPASCAVPFYKKSLSIDVLDINLILRSEYNVSYDYNPTINIESMDLGAPTYWERPSTGQSGTSRYISNVGLDENINIVVPDGQNKPYFISNRFVANGQFNGTEGKTQKVDIGFNAIEFLPSLWIPSGISPLVQLGPFNLLSLGSRNIRTIDRDIAVPDFNATVTMTPDDIPPSTVCRDTTVVLNADGFAFLDAQSVFNSVLSYDCPTTRSGAICPPGSPNADGTGKINIIDVYPDTIFCSDYPSTFGYLITEDDNCNLDTCRFTVFVQDNIIPQMGCVDITVGIGENGTYEVNPDEIAIGVTDNCRDVTVTASPDIFYCDDVGVPQLVTIFVTDIAGNTNSCQANVTVVDTMPLLLECPYLLNYPVYRNTRDGLCFYTAGLNEFKPRLVAPDCNTVITYALTGATTETGTSNVNGVNFNLGSTTITYTATDASGNSTVCSFVVIVEDTQAPIIFCPQNITIGTNHDLLNNDDCATNYSWQHPRPVDNCSIISYDVTYTYPDGTTESASLQSRYLANTLAETRNFPLGKTKIEYVAVDTMNNSVACSFIVDVIDNELPTLYCNSVVSCQPYIYDGSTDIRPNDVTSFDLYVPNNISITDLNVSLSGSALDMGQLTFSLKSPAGIIVPLFGSLCNNTTTFHLSLDDAATANVAGATCNPLGNGGVFRPTGLLSGFNGQFSQGVWQLLVTNSSPASCGTLSTFSLNICGNASDLLFSTKVSILADGGKCDFTVLTQDFDPEFTDNCPGTTLKHNYIFGPFDNTLQGAVLPLGSTSVIWTATDAAGNVRTCVIIYEVKDRNKPVFINCPEPDVIQDAEPNTCGAYVNFALPLAFDDCGGQVKVEQIDDTGLATGSIFPVGMTILTYRAVDASGNSSTCSVRVIVNDTQNGSFTCPQNTVRLTDPWLCSAVVNGIAPSQITDNCSQNATITYQIEHPANSGNIIAGGVRNASGESFQKGNSTVTYKMSSQPLLLITEVTQEIAAPIGGMSPIPYTVLTTDDYMELTNFGPAAYNVSGLIIERFGAGFSDVYEIPNKTIIQPGKTLVVHFGNGVNIPSDNFYNVPCAANLPAAQAAGYMLSFKGRILDVVTTNNYNPIGNSSTAVITGLDWIGTTGNAANRAGIIRKFSFDNNVGKDWVIAENCYPLTIGALNPDLDAYASNGTITALQSIMPHMQTCQFTVTVNDLEAPFCAEISNTNTYNGTTVSGGFDSCNEGTVTIPLANDCIVGDVNVAINGTIFGADNIFMTLTSPSGQKVNLVNNPCPGTVDGNVSLNATFDDEANNFITTACGNATWSGSFRPQQALLDFYGTKSAGKWTLTVGGTGLSNSTVNITSWTLNVTCLTPFQMDDVVINNEPGLCNSKYSWIHPYFLDNCKNGSISVAYTTSNAACVPVGTTLPVFGGQNVTQTFCVGTTKVNYTLVDGESNTQQCSFNVTVVDNEAPKLFPSACLDYAIQLLPSECERVLHFNQNPLLLGTDNCGIASVVYSPASGTAFPIGITEVILTITDKAGNKTTCSFDVIVTEHLPTSGTIACNELIHLSLNENCNATINTDMVLEGNEYRCLENYCINITTLNGLPHTNYFDLSDIGQTFIVSISDCRGSNNSCWGYVKIEEKLVPVIECPADKTVYCGANVTPDSTGFALLKSCEPFARIYHEDSMETFGLCDSPRSIITREWYIDDNQGNIVNCTQKITILPISLENIVWPKDIEVDQALECADVIQTPALTEPENTGYPTINGMKLLLGNQCMVSITKEDEIFPLCGGSYVIARTWKILHACQPLSASNPRVHVQAIKVFDTEKPNIYPCPEDMIVSTSPSACFADSINLPIPATLKDPCSNISLSVRVYGGGKSLIRGSIANNNLSIKAFNLAKGDHLVRYSATDECGNVAHCSFVVTVVDGVAPVAISKQNLIVSLSSDADGSGSGILYGWQIDNGSYDQCSDVRFEVRRVSGGSCGNVGSNGTYNNNSSYNNNNGNSNEIPGRVWFHPNDNALDNDAGEFVKFCCEDIPSGQEFGLHDVELRVWDDGNMNGVYGDNLIINGMRDNYNTVWATVRVENKLAPVLVCPPNVTVACDTDVKLRFDTDQAVDSIDLSNSGYPRAFDICTGIKITYRDQWVGQNDPVCKTGTIRRTFKVTKGSIVVTCSQLITLSRISGPFTVTFPQNNQTTIWDKCSFSLDDARDAANPIIKKPIVNHSQCDLIGENIKIDTFWFEDGACKKWRVSYSYRNWCSEEELTDFVHWYAFKDEVAPEITCSNQMFPANPSAQNPNGGCEATVILEASATDQLICAEESWIKWQVFFDGWSDGTVDRIGSSFVNTSWNGIWVSQTKFLAGGALNPIWKALQDQHPNAPLADIVFITYVNPSSASNGSVKLPPFSLDADNMKHKALWKVSDGCGNEDQCESEIQVADKKAPTPYCVSISTAIMNTNPKMVELWAKDFDKGAFDNCSPQSKLYFTFDGVAPIFDKINQEHFYKAGANGSVSATLAEYNTGTAYKWVPTTRSAGKAWTTCGDFEVKINVWDEALNTDYCISSIKVIGCGAGNTISGSVATSLGNSVENVTVTAEAFTPEYPKTFITENDGSYHFDVQKNVDYQVTARKEGDYLEGVSTLDIVLIQRHILGLEVFSDPVKLIAADANNDGKVTAADLIELRKLILGISPTLKNQSWRFPIRNQQLTMATAIPFIENYAYTLLDSDKTAQDFVAVKIGDVNFSAQSSLNSSAVEPRSNNVLSFVVQDKAIDKDETVAIPVTAQNYVGIFGYQMTMNLQNARFERIESGVLDINASNIGILSDNSKLTMSFTSHNPVSLKGDDVLFTMYVKTMKAGTVRDVIHLTSDVTKAEYYDASLHVGKVSLVYSSLQDDAFVLNQNEPNPFIGQTLIEFTMPHAAKALLTIYDVNGKQLKAIPVDAIKGRNTITLTKDQLGVLGVLYYTLESGLYKATRKMILLE